jgi:hypothetical protein
MFMVELDMGVDQWMCIIIPMGVGEIKRWINGKGCIMDGSWMYGLIVVWSGLSICRVVMVYGVWTDASGQIQ